MINQNQIKEYFKDYIYNSQKLYKRIKESPKQYIDFCNQILKKNPNLQKLSNTIIFICKELTLSKCLTCGKELLYSQTISNKKYCSNKCSNSNKNKIDLNKKKFLQKYGVDNPTKSSEIKQKIKNTNIKKYGGPAPICNKEIKQKIQNTCLKRFNTKNPAKTSIVKNKLKEKTILKSKEIIQRNIERRYHQGWLTIQSWNKFILPLFNQQQYKGRNHIYKWKCTKCGNEFYQRIYSTHFSEFSDILPRCQKCYPFLQNNGRSKLEIELSNFCKQYFPNLKENNRSLITPYELDIVIPEIKLAIEFNGIWHHSLEHGTPLGYHLMKTEMCQKQGYRLIHIFSNDWIKNKDQIKNKLEKVFRNQEKIQINEVLDRTWYKYQHNSDFIIKVIQPKVIKINNLSIENCGYIEYIEKNINNNNRT